MVGVRVVNDDEAIMKGLGGSNLQPLVLLRKVTGQCQKGRRHLAREQSHVYRLTLNCEEIQNVFANIPVKRV